MGPRDPYSQATSPRAEQPAAPGSPISADELLNAIKQARSSRPALYGLVVGTVVGVMVLLNLVAEGLFVMLCAVIGATVAWAVHGLATGRFDLGAAWEALRRER